MRARHLLAHSRQHRLTPVGLRAVAAVLVTLVSTVLGAGRADAQVNQLPMIARGTEVEEHLGRRLPMELGFTNAAGEQVHLGDYFGETPGKGVPPKATIVAMVYYGCPIACSAVLQQMAKCFDELDYTIGKDFNCLVFSFNHREGTSLAAGTKARWLASYNKPVDAEVRAAWEFHTGSEIANRALGDALGFPYNELPNGEYAHSIALFVVSPEGKIVRYIYGFEYPADQVKLSLIDASGGKIAKSLGDRISGVCFKWDGKLGKYTLDVMRVTQVVGTATVLLLAATVGGFLVIERVKRRRLTESAARVSDQTVKIERIRVGPTGAAGAGS